MANSQPPRRVQAEQSATARQEVSEPSQTYRIFDWILTSEIELPELVPSFGLHPRLAVCARTPTGAPVKPPVWYRSWESPPGTVTASFGRSGDSYVIRFPGDIDFNIDNEITRIQVTCSPPADETVRHFLLDQVLPLALSHAGEMVLHGSAVAASHGALAFVGTSGIGKSTLAAALGRMGMAVITDDAVLVHGPGVEAEVAPSYPGLRLWRDALSEELERAPRVNGYSDKRRIRGSSVPECATRTKLHSLYLIGAEDSALTIRPVSRMEAMMELAKCQFVLDSTDPARLKCQFGHAASLANAIPAYRLSYPRNLSMLESVARGVLAHHRAAGADRSLAVQI